MVLKHSPDNIMKFFRIFFILLFFNIIFLSFNDIKGNHVVTNIDVSSSTNPRSVILMIGDGMGEEQVKLARWTETGVNGMLNMEELPYKARVITNNSQDQITDSAAAATAIATGLKTNNGILSQDSSKNPLLTILEYTISLKKSTGVVSTTEFTHATPAAFFSHVSYRGLYSEIARQLIEEANVDIIMGGGKGRLTSEQISFLESRGYKLAENRSQMLSLTSGRSLGLFDNSYLPYDKDRNREIIPSLSEMTSKALELLSQDPDGFFLIVEGGQIDWACHDNDIIDTVVETIEFDKAVEVAKNYTLNHDKTLLIITADHETGGLTVVSEYLNSTLPSINRNPEDNEELRIVRVNNISVSWAGTGHTATNVPLYGIGQELTTINDTTIDNTEIFSLIKNHIELDSESKEIIIHSPLNKSYYNENIWLSVSFNDTTSWMGYSLNDEPNVTLVHHNTLIAFPESRNQLHVYANLSSNIEVESNVIFEIVLRNITFTTNSSISTSSMDSSTPGFLILPLFIYFIPLFIYLKRKF